MTEALIASPEPEPEPEPEPFSPTGIQTRTLNPYPNQALMAPRGERSLERVRVANALLMHARADSFVEPNGSRAFFERAQCPGSKAHAHPSPNPNAGPSPGPNPNPCPNPSPNPSPSPSPNPTPNPSPNPEPSSTPKPSRNPNPKQALVLFGGAAAASELCTAGPPTALAELEAIKDVDMWHALTQAPSAPPQP